MLKPRIENMMCMYNFKHRLCSVSEIVSISLYVYVSIELIRNSGVALTNHDINLAMKTNVKTPLRIIPCDPLQQTKPIKLNQIFLFNIQVLRMT